MSGLVLSATTGLLTLAVASLLAGAVNAIAGGGTVLTFPVLDAILPGPGHGVAANVTSTIGLWPGAAVAAWSWRGERSGLPSWTRLLVAPSVAGAAVGALLLVLSPDCFDALVPWLILLAAVLFAVQPRVATFAAAHDASAATPVGRVVVACGLQFLVGIYGGYFGAGIGILMLAVLGLMGLGDIRRLNAVKNVLGMWVNGVAAALFAAGSWAGVYEVSWPHAALMAVGAVAGSLGASHVTRRLPASVVRRIVAIIGFGLAGYYFWRRIASAAPGG
ncbi:MAG: sulfite exporter TauE/SafE family protein [Planctomycetia bacterium]|nr:sulfite exporter TauE/SafE family protein [Planctomycetia bacterium]